MHSYHQEFFPQSVERLGSTLNEYKQKWELIVKEQSWCGGKYVESVDGKLPRGRVILC